VNRPSFQFYTKDWRSNSKLRRCSPAARGVWVDVLCALHDSDDYGIARYPLKELASEVGASMAHVRELVAKDVLKGSDSALDEAFIYVPRSGRKDGDPVTLVPTQAGPIWYSSRMVKDEYIRTVRGESTRFGEGEGDTPKKAPKAAPIPPFGDGSSTASATAVKEPPSPRRGKVHDFPPGFEDFWSAYPKKVGKDAAAKAFARRKVDEMLLASMLSAIGAQRRLEQWTRDGGQYIPHPATWLNEGRWQDEAGQTGDAEPWVGAR